MSIKQKTPTILFIVGSGRSGSTILDLTIGANSSCFSIGEIQTLGTEIKKKGWCTCGKKYYDCAFWKKVGQNLKKRDSDIFNEISLSLKFPNNKDKNIIGKIKNLIVLLGKGNESIKIIGDNKILFSAIFENINENIIIDSSKNIKRAILLYRKLGYKCKILHMVRDLRGIAHSSKKRTYSVCLPPDFRKKTCPAKEIRSVEQISKSWKKENSLIIWLLNFIVKDNDHMLIRYEDLIQDPEATIRDICGWLQIDYSENMVNFGSVIHHNVGGNPSRFNSTAIKKLPEKWKTELSEYERNYCLQYASHLLKRFKYA